MLNALLVAVPDAYTGQDGVISILFEINSAQLENLYLAHQLLLEDMFVTTASYQALTRHGEQYGLSPSLGTFATGVLEFQGAGASYIPIGSQVAYDPAGGLDPVYYVTTIDGTITNPGIPTPPTVSINPVAGNLNGMYEYQTTFVTVYGETLPSAISAAVSPVNQQVNLVAIPLGGPGTISRRIYRDENGAGLFRMIAEIADNVTYTYNDNITDAAAAIGSLAPTVDSAHRIQLEAQSVTTGVDSNVAVGVINMLVTTPPGISSVTNITPFSGGADPQSTDDFRQDLLNHIRSPGTGSPDDLVDWATSVPGVESATVFPLIPGPGEVTVRISGPGGTIPDAALISQVQTVLQAQDLANITIHVSSFDPVTTDVTVDVTTVGTYTLGDVTASVRSAITNYINGLDVGETFRVAGVVDSIFGLPGVTDVVVTLPSANLTTTSTQKRIPGTITVI